MNPGFLMGWLSGFFDQLRCNVGSDHAARQFSQALETDSLAVVHLPPPDDIGGLHGEYDAWWGRYPDNDLSQAARWPGYDVSTDDGEICYGGNNLLPEEARALGATFLAAAAAAEAGVR